MPSATISSSILEANKGIPISLKAAKYLSVASALIAVATTISGIVAGIFPIIVMGTIFVAASFSCFYLLHRAVHLTATDQKEKEKKILDLTTDQAANETRINELTTELAEKELRINELTTMLAEKDKKISDLTANLGIKQTYDKTKLEQVGAAQAGITINQAKLNLAEAEESVRKLQSDRDALQQQITKLKAEFEEKDKTLTSERNASQQQITAFKTEIHQIKKTNALLESRVTGVNFQANDIQQLLKVWMESDPEVCSKLKDKYASLGESINKLTKLQATDLKAMLQNLQSYIETSEPGK